VYNSFKNIKGHREFFQVTNGVWEKIGEDHNMITNEGVNILAKAITNKAHINAMYLCFENTDTTNYNEAKTNNAEYYAGIAANRGIVRISTLGEPIFSDSDSQYSHNKVTFLGVSDGTTMFPTVTVQDGTSIFYHTALVAMSDSEDQTKDMIFSCGDLTVPITKIAGSQIGIRWTITFTSP